MSGRNRSVLSPVSVASLPSSPACFIGSPQGPEQLSPPTKIWGFPSVPWSWRLSWWFRSIADAQFWLTNRRSVVLAWSLRHFEITSRRFSSQGKPSLPFWFAVFKPPFDDSESLTFSGTVSQGAWNNWPFSLGCDFLLIIAPQAALGHTPYLPCLDLPALLNPVTPMDQAGISGCCNHIAGSSGSIKHYVLSLLLLC